MSCHQGHMPNKKLTCRGCRSVLSAASGEGPPDEAIVLLEALDKAALPRPAGLRIGPRLPGGADLHVHQDIETKQPL